MVCLGQLDEVGMELETDNSVETTALVMLMRITVDAGSSIALPVLVRLVLTLILGGC
jgi:hypothetical protein